MLYSIRVAEAPVALRTSPLAERRILSTCLPADQEIPTDGNLKTSHGTLNPITGGHADAIHASPGQFLLGLF